MDTRQTSADPIIRSMQDPPSRIPFEPDTSARPTEPPAKPFGVPPPPSAPPKQLGNPPSAEVPPPTKPKIAYRPPDAPKAPEPMRQTQSAAQPPPSIPTAPPTNGKPPTFTEQPPHKDGSSPAIVTLLILILVLLAFGLPLLWLKMNALDNKTGTQTIDLGERMDTLSDKVTGVDNSVKNLGDVNAAAKQDLFTAGSDILKCADEDARIADLLITEGTRLKNEGDAAKDQPKSMQGQWLIDRGNELKQNSVTCRENGNRAQSRSGIPVNK